jgi:hypothetical protein
LGRLLVRLGFGSEITAPPVLTATPGAAEDVAPDVAVPDDAVPDDVDTVVDGEPVSVGDTAEPEDVDVDAGVLPALGVAELVDDALADDELAEDESDPASADVSADATPQP